MTKTSTTTVWATLTVNRGSATTSSQQGNGSLVSAPAPVVTGGDDDEVSSTVTATTTTTTTVWVDEEGNALSPTSAFAVPCHATPTAQPGALTPIEPGPYPTANSSGLVLPTGFTRPGSGSVSGTITDHVSAPAPTETVPVTSGGGKMIGGTGSALVLGALTVAVAMCVM